MTDALTAYERRRRQEDRDLTWAGWQCWSRWGHLRNYGYGVEAADRVRKALLALREWRRASNGVPESGQEESLAVRVAADTFASQIETHAPDTADADTIAWVTAGLRCPAQPFCTGCPSCQTVTSPLRPNTEPRRTW